MLCFSRALMGISDSEKLDKLIGCVLPEVDRLTQDSYSEVILGDEHFDTFSPFNIMSSIWA